MKNEESEEELKKLLELYNKGRLPAARKAHLDSQLDSFRKSDRTEFEFNQQHSDTLWRKIAAETIGKKQPRSRMWISIAAAMIITGAAVLLMLSWNHDTTGYSNKIMLADGSIVWLKDGATLDHSSLGIDHREVTLTGEALFEVARIPQQPFVIHCGNYDARVLGTSFNLKSTSSSVELTVLTGTVLLSSVDADRSILVNPHESVVLGPVSNIRRISPDPVAIKNIIANTQYDMHFEDTRMEDVVKRVEGKFDVKIELKNADIANCMISADFTDQSLPLTLAMISEALGFQYEIDGNDVVISGSGCKE